MLDDERVLVLLEVESLVLRRHLALGGIIVDGRPDRSPAVKKLSDRGDFEVRILEDVV
jgi:hypothetical protein